MQPADINSPKKSDNQEPPATQKTQTTMLQRGHWMLMSDLYFDWTCQMKQSVSDPKYVYNSPRFDLEI